MSVIRILSLSHPPVCRFRKTIGGEYGEVRATIDIDRLNAYLATNTPSVKTPVGVKQFKVRPVNLQTAIA
jgi:hypothetical protein